MVSSTPRPHFTPGNDPVPILQKAGWAPGPVWTGGKSRPQWDSIPDRPARSQSLYRLSYPAHKLKFVTNSKFGMSYRYESLFKTGPHKFKYNITNTSGISTKYRHALSSFDTKYPAYKKNGTTTLCLSTLRTSTKRQTDRLPKKSHLIPTSPYREVNSKSMGIVDLREAVEYREARLVTTSDIYRLRPERKSRRMPLSRDHTS